MIVAVRGIRLLVLGREVRSTIVPIRPIERRLLKVKSINKQVINYKSVGINNKANKAKLSLMIKNNNKHQQNQANPISSSLIKSPYNKKKPSRNA